jgi:hypothetical protein
LSRSAEIADQLVGMVRKQIGKRKHIDRLHTAADDLYQNQRFLGLSVDSHQCDAAIQKDIAARYAGLPARRYL